MKRLLLLPLLLLISCTQKQEWVDLIIYNANIYTVDSTFSVKQSMAINGGKIVAIGTDEEIKTKYNSSTILDINGKTIFPGFIDAHCHFVGYGLGLQRADLSGTKSFEEVLQRLPQPTEESLRNGSWIIGRGWDQNDWETKEYPTNEKLNSLYPNTPVFLKRIDGHAALVNETALRLAGLNEKSKISGGEFVLNNGKLTGVLIDNAVDLVAKVIPDPDKEQVQKALLAAQKNCFAVGLTSVDDAGLMKREIDIIDELQKKGELKMRIYAMLSDSAPNYKYYLNAGPYKTDKLNVRSF
ncbi:MAG: amidohydrolase, partial [Bacteroidia bacterium]